MLAPGGYLVTGMPVPKIQETKHNDYILLEKCRVFEEILEKTAFEK